MGQVFDKRHGSPQGGRGIGRARMRNNIRPVDEKLVETILVRTARMLDRNLK